MEQVVEKICPVPYGPSPTSSSSSSRCLGGLRNVMVTSSDVGFHYTWNRFIGFGVHQFVPLAGEDRGYIDTADGNGHYKNGMPTQGIRKRVLDHRILGS